MSTLRAALAFCALTAVSACSPQGDEVRGDPIACAIGHAGKLERTCRLERTGTGTALQFVVHHADGGFRRLELAPDGKGLLPSDGADKAVSVVTPDAIELTIGPDSYRIPLELLKPVNDQ